MDPAKWMLVAKRSVEMHVLSEMTNQQLIHAFRRCILRLGSQQTQ